MQKYVTCPECYEKVYWERNIRYCPECGWNIEDLFEYEEEKYGKEEEEMSIHGGKGHVPQTRVPKVNVPQTNRKDTTSVKVMFRRLILLAILVAIFYFFFVKK